MNILIIGSGGREHALAWKIKQSNNCEKLFIAPGNAGTSAIAENVAIAVNDFPKLKEFVLLNNIDLLIVGPEDPLVNGLRDYFEDVNPVPKVAIVGPGKAGARLEGSKDFSKSFMNKYNIPTAKATTFEHSTLEDGLAYLKTMPLPIVLKADGLAAGKGVIICETLTDAQVNLEEMLKNNKFGKAGNKVVVEEFLKGIELSVFVLTDGEDYIILPEAKDYKRIGEGDTGLNTGGMGAVSPVAFANKDFMDKVDKKIIQPTIHGLKSEEIDYSGFIFLGIMNVEGEPYVIEYNVRLGDPETEVVIPRIKSDLVDLLWAAANRRLKHIEIETNEQVASTVVLVSEGYPEAYEKGRLISGLENIDKAIIFHAGTKQDGEQVFTNGGRVIAVTGLGEDITQALDNSYKAAAQIKWEGINFRKDIGADLMSLT